MLKVPCQAMDIFQALGHCVNSYLSFLITSSLFSDVLPSGDFAALVYLWNPFTIVACVGLSTSAIENLMVLLTLYGACARKQLTICDF
jgi:phosphatidylinositol glycan class U